MKKPESLGVPVLQREIFPDPLRSGREGLVSIGPDISAKALLEAYSFGIFPWPEGESTPVLWFSPARRGVLDFKDLHIPRRMEKYLKQSSYKVTWNRCFDQVLNLCADQPRKGQDGTWITEEIKRSYLQLHQKGWAHSVECWDGEELVGGIYGVHLGMVFSGESMFYLKPNASKICLVHLIKKLQSQGQTWIDIQMVTPVLKQFGGKYISRKEFFQRLDLERTQLGERHIGRLV